MKWQKLQQYGFSNTLFHQKGICSVNNKKGVDTLHARNVVAQVCCAGHGIARVCRLRVHWEEKRVAKESCSRTGVFSVASLFLTLFYCYPIPNNKDFKTFKATGVSILRPSCHSQDLSVSKLAKHGIVDLGSFSPYPSAVLLWRFSVFSKVSGYFWYQPSLSKVTFWRF